MKKIHYFLFFYFVHAILFGQIRTGYLTDNGAWSWFSGPRAIMHNDNVILGWVKATGTIETSKLNINTSEIKTHELYYKLEVDDHNNPAFVKTGSDEVLAMYTRHSKKDLFINRLKDPDKRFEFSKPQLIHPILEKDLNKFPMETITYANPFSLEKENNRIYCFGRWTGFKPNIMWSDDNGNTWSKSKIMIANQPFDIHKRPYVKYFSDGISKIHIVFTDGHPKQEPNNSVYYAYYENGSFYKASGKKICDIDNLPIEPKDADIIYNSGIKEGRAWIADIGEDKNKQPIVLFTKSPTTENHEYWYSSYTNSNWQNNKICDSGTYFPDTIKGEKQPEPYYFGGMSIHPNKSNVIYLSRQINKVFEIERWETIDKGKNWKSISMTKNSIYNNVRPYIPSGLKRDSKEIVLWMVKQNYHHYTRFKTGIKYLIYDINNLNYYKKSSK